MVRLGARTRKSFRPRSRWSQAIKAHKAGLAHAGRQCKTEGGKIPVKGRDRSICLLNALQQGVVSPALLVPAHDVCQNTERLRLGRAQAQTLADIFVLVHTSIPPSPAGVAAGNYQAVPLFACVCGGRADQFPPLPPRARQGLAAGC